jgi:acyl-CoA thioester hydrolase
METTRIEFIKNVLPQFTQTNSSELKQSLVLAEARCRFKVSLVYPDDIIISAAISDISESQFVVHHQIYSQKFDCIAAEGDARMVYFDFEKKRKALLPQELVCLLESYSLPSD